MTGGTPVPPVNDDDDDDDDETARAEWRARIARHTLR
jgi:hypothetical protein